VKFLQKQAALFVNFLVIIKLRLSLSKLELEKSLNVIKEDFVIWNSSLLVPKYLKGPIEKDKILILSVRRALLNPYNGILHFYLSIASIAGELGITTKILVLGKIHSEIPIGKNVSIISTPYTRSKKIRFLFPEHVLWRHTLQNYASQYHSATIMGPNTEIEMSLPEGKKFFLIVSLHTDWLLDPGNINFLRRSRGHWISAYYLHYKPNLWIANSRELINDFKKVGVNFQKKNLMTIPHVSQKTENFQKENIVLFVGKQDQRKSPLLLAEAWSELSDKYTSWRLVFIGPKGSETKKLLKMMKSSSNITVLGSVSPAQKLAWLAKSKVVVLPSTYESFGYVGAEALQARCNLLARDIPTIREATSNSAIYFSDRRDLVRKLALCIDKDEFPVKFQSVENKYVRVWAEILKRSLGDSEI